MTIPSFENSRFGGSPIELYLFSQGTPTEYRVGYTTADRDINYGGVLFKAGVVGRAEVVIDDERGSADIEIRIPESEEIIKRLHEDTSSVPYSVECFRTHEGASQTDRFWFGEASSVSTDKEVGTILCQQLRSSFDKQIPIMPVLRTCPYMQFDLDCGLAEADFTQNCTVTAISGNNITVTGVGTGLDGYYKLGQLKIGQARTFIESHVGGVVKVTNLVPGLTVGAAVKLVAGDDKLVDTCRVKFDNVERFGGFPLSPSKNPFKGLQ